MAKARFQAEAARRLKASEEDQALLIAGALPRSAGPYLEFGDELARALPAAADVVTGAPAGERYRVIGGQDTSLICVDQEDGGVVVLEPENAFRRLVMNSSVARLVRSLEIYRSGVDRAIRQVGEEAWWKDGRFPLEIARSLSAELRAADPKAWAKKGFWAREARATVDLAEEAARTTVDSTADLAARLGGRSLKERRRAADQLMRLGKKAAGAERALAKALGDRDAGVRINAALALKNIGPAGRAAIPALLRRLRDEVPAVVGSSLEALGRAGPLPKSARRPLEALLESPYPWIRRPAARLLTRLSGGR